VSLINRLPILKMEPPVKNQDSETPVRFSSWIKVLEYLLGTRQGRTFTLSLLGLLILGIGGATSLAIYLIRPDKVEVTTGVGALSIKTSKTQSAVLLVSAAGASSDRHWIDTDIEVKAGDKIKVTASGQVYTSSKWLTFEGLSPEFRESAWTGPAGLPRSQDYNFQAKRNQYKVLPDKNGAYYGYGMLLAIVKDRDRGQYPTEEIIPIGQKIENAKEGAEFQAQKDGTLSFTVNDIWLTPNMKNVYIEPKENTKYYLRDARLRAYMRGEHYENWPMSTQKKMIEEAYAERVKKWDKIDSSKQWNAWYADNIGSFLVSVSVNK
jgi:hypothetical protein